MWGRRHIDYLCWLRAVYKSLSVQISQPQQFFVYVCVLVRVHEGESERVRALPRHTVHSFISVAPFTYLNNLCLLLFCIFTSLLTELVFILQCAGFFWFIFHNLINIESPSSRLRQLHSGSFSTNATDETFLSFHFQMYLDLLTQALTLFQQLNLIFLVITMYKMVKHSTSLKPDSSRLENIK